MNLDEIVQNTAPIASTAGTSTPPIQPWQAQVQNIPQQVQSQTPQVTIPQQVAVAQEMPVTPNQQQVAPNLYEVVQTPLPPQQINVNVWGKDEHISIEWLDSAKKKKTNWFFRVLSLIALLWVGFLMLGESANILKINLAGFELANIYPIVVLISVVILFVYKNILSKILWLIIFLLVVWGISTVSLYHSLVPSAPDKFVKDIAFDMQDGTSAKLVFNTHVGNFDINGWDIPVLLEGKFDSDRQYIISSGFTEENVPYLYFDEDTNRNLVQQFKSNLDVTLKNKYSYDLYLKNFLWDHNIDLRSVVFDHVILHDGIGDMTVLLWSQVKNDSQIDIKSAWSNIEFNIPKNVWVILYYDQVAWSIELTNFKKSEEEENMFTSLNIDSADVVVKISVDVIVGKFQLHWLD